MVMISTAAAVGGWGRGIIPGKSVKAFSFEIHVSNCKCELWKGTWLQNCFQRLGSG